MALVSGPSPYIGKKVETWAFDPGYGAYTAPDSPDVTPSQYGPGPVSSLLDPADLKAITKHATPYSAMRPTTSWADVVDSSVRAQQKREQGVAGQPQANGRPEQPNPEQAQNPEQDLQKQQASQRAAAARAKIQQAQRVRQAAEQAHNVAQDKVGAADLQVKTASDKVKQAQNDLDDWDDDNPDKDPPDDLQEAMDSAQQMLETAQKARESAAAEEQQANAALQEAVQGEDAATKEFQQAEQEQQTAEQTAEQAQQQQDQAAQSQQAEGPYGGNAPSDEQSNPEQGVAGEQAPGQPPSAEPGQPEQQDPISRVLAQVKAQGGNAEALLDAVAAEAWRKESGRAAPNWLDPNEVKAYDDYRANWKGAYRAGQDVPLAGDLRNAANQKQGAPAQPQGAPQSSAPTQPAPFDPSQPVTPSNQPPANPNLIGGLDRPPLAGPGAVSSQPGTASSPGAGPQPGATPGAPTAGGAKPGLPGAPPAPGATPPSGPQLEQANQTLAAAQARDAELRKALDSANSAADAAQKKMEAAQETAKKLSNELSSGVGSPEYRQYSLTPALNQAQGAVSDAAQQLASARARAAQTQQMLATSQQSIASAQNLVKLASVPPPGAGPAAATAQAAGDSAQAGQLLNTMLAKATPEQQQRILADIATGGPAGTEVLRQIATQAWYKQLAAQGQTAAPGGPPKDYIESWMGMYRANQTGAPLIAAVKAELARRGLNGNQAGAPPAAGAPASGPAAAVLTRPEMLRMTPQERTMYDQWVQAGGSGRWEDFQQHAVAVGAPQPGNRRVYTDPRDAGVLPPSQGAGPAGSVVQSGVPATDPRAAGYIAARRQAGDTRSDAELEAEFHADTAPMPATNTSGPTQSVLDSSQVARLPGAGQADAQSGLTLIARNETEPMVVGEDGTARPMSSVKVYPPQLPPEQRGLWDEWRRAGGSGNWEQFQAHARAVGAGEIGPARISDPRDAGGTTAGQVRPVYPVADNPDSSSEGGPMSGPLGTFTPPPAPRPRTITSPAPLPSETPSPLPAGAPRPPTAPGAMPSALAVEVGAGPESVDPIAVSARSAGIQDDAGQANVANGIAAWARGDQAGAWAEDHIDNAAKLAWYLQAGKAAGARPDDAPADYIAAWKTQWLAGSEDAPLQAELNSALQKWGLQGAGHPPGSSGYDWRSVYGQNGERLAPRQLTGNDCGPTAAVAFGRAVGLDPDQRKVFEWAKAHGYHDGEQFQGTGAMQRMLSDMGIKSDVGAVDWGRIDQELAAGRPVMVSGPGHYWLISGKDPQSGAYYTGQTGEVVREGSWEKPGQFRYGGGVNQAVYLVDTNNPAGSAMVQGGAATVVAPTVAASVRTPSSPAAPPAAAQPVPVAENYDQVKALFESGQIPTVNPGALPADQRSPEGQAAWAKAWAPTLEELSKRTGIDSGVLFGLITSESGWGTQMQGNNVMGLMAGPGQRMQFNNPTESILYAVQMWSNPAANNGRYQAVWANRRDANAFVNALANSGYADPAVDNISSWSNILLSNARVYNRAMGR